MTVTKLINCFDEASVQGQAALMMQTYKAPKVYDDNANRREKITVFSN